MKVGHKEVSLNILSVALCDIKRALILRNELSQNVSENVNRSKAN